MEQSKISDQKSKIIIFSDRAALAHDAARRFIDLGNAAIRASGRFAVALSGGSTPRDLYALLATPPFAAQIDWTHVHFFWGDERAVPPDHPDSNYRMAHEALLSKIPVPPRHVHRIQAELEPDAAAQEYEQTLRDFFGAATGAPAFDLILLGLGANGHTASLFPHTNVLNETHRWVAAEYINEVQMYRITLTVPVINAAHNIVWLVAGADKAQTVHDVLYGTYQPAELPAQLIKPEHGVQVWLLDREASREI